MALPGKKRPTSTPRMAPLNTCSRQARGEEVCVCVVGGGGVSQNGRGLEGCKEEVGVGGRCTCALEHCRQAAGLEADKTLALPLLPPQTSPPRPAPHPPPPALLPSPAAACAPAPP
jgi:hypothetical protein